MGLGFMDSVKGWFYQGFFREYSKGDTGSLDSSSSSA